MNLSDNVYIINGGLGTEIERRGASLSNDPLWSSRLLVTNPQLVCDIHKSFLQCGADILTTDSYQISIDILTENLNISPCEAQDLIGQSVSLAQEARDWFLKQPELKSEGRLRPIIAGSVGPRGACLCDGSEYTGDYMDRYTTEEIKEWHRPRLVKLIESGVDIIAIETFPSLKEAVIIIDLLKDYPNTNCWISFSCKDEVHTCYGDVFADAVKVLSQYSQVVAVGINCSNPNYIERLLASAQDCNIPFVAYPNNGEDWLPHNTWSGVKLNNIIPELSKKWMTLGAKIIGGCCRVTPEDISNIKKHLFVKH